jgi:hypothetical protein
MGQCPSRVSWVSSSFSVVLVKPEYRQHGLSQILQILHPASKDSSRELKLTGFAFPLERIEELLKPLSNLRSLKLCGREIVHACSRAAGLVRLQELAELDVTGTRRSPPKTAASDHSECVGRVLEFPKLRKLTMGFNDSKINCLQQSLSEQQLLWEHFPFPRTLEILRLDSQLKSLGTSAVTWFLMRMVFPRLATSCPALQEVHIRSWISAAFRDNKLYNELFDDHLEVATLCKEFPLLEKIRLNVSRSTEDGAWEEDGNP